MSWVSTGGCRPRNNTGFFRPTPAAVPCWPRMLPKRPLRCPGSALSWTSGRHAFLVTAGGPRSSVYPSNAYHRLPPINEQAAAGAWGRAFACGCTRGGLRLPRPFYRARDIAYEPGVGRVADGRHRPRGDREFPIFDPPDKRNVKDGVALLEELGALVATPGDGRPVPPPRSGQAGTAGGWRGA